MDEEHTYAMSKMTGMNTYAYNINEILEGGGR